MNLRSFVPLLVIIVFVANPLSIAQAGRFDNLIEAMLRKSVSKADDLGPPLLKSSKVDNVVVAAQRSDDQLLKEFNRLGGVDDRLRSTFKKLSTDERTAVVEIVSAGQRVALGRSADDAVKLIRKLDADGLVQGRTYGEFVYAGVDKMGPYYKSVVAKMGEGAGVFFNKYVAPHWGKWSAAGLTAAYLAAPEKFHYQLGNLTEYAVGKLTEAGIRVGEAVTGGVVGGITQRLKTNPVYATITLALIALLVLLQIPRFRAFVLRTIVHPLWSAPPTNESNDSQQHYEE